MSTMRFRTRLEHDGEIMLKGIPAKKGEEADITVRVVRRKRARYITLGELLRSDIVGIWSDRTDIGDSVEYARELRKARQP